VPKSSMATRSPSRLIFDNASLTQSPASSKSPSGISKTMLSPGSRS
jgi:hypothetical protein